MSDDDLASTETPAPEAAAPAGGVSRRGLLFGGGAAVGLAAVAGGTALLTRSTEPGDFRAARIDGPLPVDDPDHDTWGKARRVTLPLVRQNMANPHLTEQTVTALRARALFNGTDLGVLVEWDDDEVDEIEGIATFRDAVAVMMPADLGASGTPIFMGWEGQPVYLAHWKASWQADVDRGFVDVEHKHPNWYPGVNPYSETLVELGFPADKASLHSPARHLGNAMAQTDRRSPVEELSAEGYGSLTHLDDQGATGRGIRTDKGWKVAIGIPGGANAPALGSAATVPLALAVWQGEHQQRGGRKQYVDWVDLILAEGA